MSYELLHVIDSNLDVLVLEIGVNAAASMRCVCKKWRDTIDRGLAEISPLLSIRAGHFLAAAVVLGKDRGPPGVSREPWFILVEACTILHPGMIRYVLSTHKRNGMGPFAKRLVSRESRHGDKDIARARCLTVFMQYGFSTPYINIDYATSNNCIEMTRYILSNRRVGHTFHKLQQSIHNTLIYRNWDILRLLIAHMNPGETCPDEFIRHNMRWTDEYFKNMMPILTPRMRMSVYVDLRVRYYFNTQDGYTSRCAKTPKRILKNITSGSPDDHIRCEFNTRRPTILSFFDRAMWHISKYYGSDSVMHLPGFQIYDIFMTGSLDSINCKNISVCYVPYDDRVSVRFYRND